MAPTLSSVIIALVVAVWIHPALAATGTLARCDRSIDGAPTPVPDDDRLSLQVIGHASNTAVASEQMSSADTDSEPAAVPGADATNSRVAAVLRRTARETHWTHRETEQSADQGMPLVADKVEAAEESPRMLDPEPAEATAERSGFSDDDLVRHLQRQMYRTDI